MNDYDYDYDDDDDDGYYAGRAEQELNLAAEAVDTAVKAIHLDMAARYPTLRELTSAPHRTIDPRLYAAH